ncbi:MAG: hypothetical protein F4Y06_09515 [Rhodospirillales bacterium]|nr:hypothetical protein [Rhodospirillales bacterium]
MTAYGYVGWALVLASLGACCSARYTDNWRIKLGTAAAVVVAAFAIQLDRVPLIGFVASVQSEPSVAMILILGSHGARSLWPHRLTQPDTGPLHLCIFLLGSAMYPSALGIGYIDLYAAGYHPYAAIGMLPLAFLLSWFAGTRLLAFWVALAVLAQGYSVGESDNAFDYLIDPIIFVYACWRAAAYAWRRYDGAR